MFDLGSLLALGCVVFSLKSDAPCHKLVAFSEY
jgi:hypothetical protein